MKRQSCAIAGRTAWCRCKFRNVSHFYNGIVRFLSHSAAFLNTSATPFKMLKLHPLRWRKITATAENHGTQVLVLMTPPLFHPNFGGVPVGQIADIGNPSRKATSREIIFEVFQVPTYVVTIPERHRRTDRHTNRQTNGQTTYCGITSLCVASRGKIRKYHMEMRISSKKNVSSNKIHEL